MSCRCIPAPDPTVAACSRPTPSRLAWPEQEPIPLSPDKHESHDGRIGVSPITTTWSATRLYALRPWSMEVVSGTPDSERIMVLGLREWRYATVARCRAEQSAFGPACWPLEAHPHQFLVNW